MKTVLVIRSRKEGGAWGVHARTYFCNFVDKDSKVVYELDGIQSQMYHCSRFS